MKTIVMIAATCLISSAAIAGEIPQELIDSAIKDSAAVVVASATQPEASSINWQMIVGTFLSVYEILIRLVPTVKDYSLLSWAVRLLTTLLPNRKSEGGVHK